MTSTHTELALFTTVQRKAEGMITLPPPPLQKHWVRPTAADVAEAAAAVAAEQALGEVKKSAAAAAEAQLAS